MRSNLLSFLLNRIPKKKQYISIAEKKLHIPADMAWCFSGGEYYETNVIYWMDRLMKSLDSPVFYDIGANIGYYSIKYSDEAKHVYSFEPVKRTYKLLSRNIHNNNITNVTAFNIGLSNENSGKSINLYSSSGNNSLFNRNIPGHITLNKVGEEKIKLAILDEFIINEQLLAPQLIKIDVEGNELQVLKGAKNLIQKYTPFFLIEYSENTCRDAGYIPENILEELGSNNYTIYGIPDKVTDFTLIDMQNFDKTQPGNILAIPKSKGILLK